MQILQTAPKTGADFDLEELLPKLKAFSEDSLIQAEIQTFPGTDIFFFRARCYEWSQEVLRLVIDTHLVGDSFWHYYNNAQPLDRMVEHAVETYIRDTNEDTVYAIVKQAGQQDMGPWLIDQMFRRFKRAAEYYIICRKNASGYDQIVRQYAREILWAETLSFLVFDGRFEEVLPFSYEFHDR